MTNQKQGATQGGAAQGEATQRTASQRDATPLSEANPASLDELFSRDPRGYAKADRAQIVAELRRMRVVWAQAEAQGATKAPRKAQAAALPVSAEDIGI